LRGVDGGIARKNLCFYIIKELSGGFPEELSIRVLSG
jgi:hypothetical protein